MLILSATLFIFSIFLYNSLKQDLSANLDNLLKSKAGGIEESIDTYLETRKPEGGGKADPEYFIKIAQHLVDVEEVYDPRLVKIIVQIFNIKGENIAHTKNIPYIITFPKELFDEVLKGRSRFDEFYIDLPENKKLRLRIFIKPVFEDKEMIYIVQVAAPLTAINSTLNGLKLILFVLLPLTVIITGLAGAFLARSALRPVDNMINSARQITTENLKLRIHTPKSNDEIQRLAETFNELLGRLDKAFTGQKQFTQDVTHELRTPLTILRGQIEVALKRPRSGAEYGKILRSCLEEINFLNKIVENLLMLASFEDKDLKLEIKPVELNVLAAKVIKDMRVLAKKKGLSLQFTGKEGVMIRADENYIRRLFLNLIDNAVKYTQAGGKVAVSLKKTAGFAVIRISDTGAGIPKKDLPYIYNRFFRLEKSRSSEGFGLGLSIVRSIVEAHKGKIRVRSKTGKGTEFTIQLPR